jgi:uncharacterized protein YcbK (DUF882 family)
MTAVARAAAVLACVFAMTAKTNASTIHHHQGIHQHHSAHAHRHAVRRAHHHRSAHAGRHSDRHTSTSTAGLPGPLVAALDRIKEACTGFRLISTFRPGARVAGSGRPSLHAFHKAADFAVTSWRCAYAALKGFRGGVSTDPGRVGHIHASWDPGGREWGARFAHWHGGHHHRYALR